MLRIIPVIDLKEGRVVRGVGGRREDYRPIQSRLAADPRPASIGSAFAGLGMDECYVADLDAIAGAAPNWQAFGELLDCGLRLWVDAGCGNVTRSEVLALFQHGGRPLERIIVGLETLPSVEALAAMASVIGPRRMVFSLDLRQGVPLAREGVWPGAQPVDIVKEVVSLGIQRVIVLDLAAVGTYQGPAALDACSRIRSEFAGIELFSGGGIRTAADVERFAEAGCDGVLVASALHDGHLP